MILKPIITQVLFDRDSIEKAKRIRTDDKMVEFLTENEVQKSTIIKWIENYYKVEYLNIKEVTIDKNIFALFNINELKYQFVIPYKVDLANKTYYFALSDMSNELRQNLTVICNKIDFKANFKFSFEKDIIDKYEELENVKVIANKNETEEANDSVNDSANENVIVKWVNDLLNRAIEYNASDIHIEHLEKQLRVRFRIDGVLTKEELYDFEKEVIKQTINRIKIKADMDIAIDRKPQDGGIKNHIYNSKKYDMRVSSVNTHYGEKFVLRLFEKSSVIPTFKQLGFNETEEEKILKMLRNKDGIIFLAGATGSGKTTSLYTMINAINSNEINIYTIEDPIEKTIECVNQIQINERSGVTYTSTLKALLRQDPDVIVVGETRDTETADLSMRASLTGHLVLTTIHANNSIDTISRLLDMDIETYLLNASVLGIVSQRLVRVLCPHCKEKVTEIKPFQKRWIEEVCEEHNLPIPEENSFYKAVGCEHCNKGYKGRVALTETLEISENIKTLISNKAKTNEIKKIALQEGFKTLKYNGLQLVIEGKSSIEEVIRQI